MVIAKKLLGLRLTQPVPHQQLPRKPALSVSLLAPKAGNSTPKGKVLSPHLGSRKKGLSPNQAIQMGLHPHQKVRVNNPNLTKTTSTSVLQSLDCPENTKPLLKQTAWKLPVIVIYQTAQKASVEGCSHDQEALCELPSSQIRYDWLCKIWC